MFAFTIHKDLVDAAYREQSPFICPANELLRHIASKGLLKAEVPHMRKLTRSGLCNRVGVGSSPTAREMSGNGQGEYSKPEARLLVFEADQKRRLQLARRCLASSWHSLWLTITSLFSQPNFRAGPTHSVQAELESLPLCRP